MEASICTELGDYFTYRDDPTPLTKSLNDAKLKFKKKRRELRRIKLNLLDLDEIIEEGVEKINKDEYDNLVQLKVKGEEAIRRADDEVHRAQVALASVERHWPEVSGILGNLGIPKELHELWRAERNSSHYYTSYQPLIGAVARPGNQIIRAERNGKVTVIKEYGFQSNKNYHTSLKEARILHRLRHPNIVEILSIFKLDRSQNNSGNPVFCIEMPFYKHGQLDEFLFNEKPDVLAVKRIFLDVLKAIHHLHVHGIVSFLLELFFMP